MQKKRESNHECGVNLITLGDENRDCRDDGGATNAASGRRARIVTIK